MFSAFLSHMSWLPREFGMALYTHILQISGWWSFMVLLYVHSISGKSIEATYALWEQRPQFVLPEFFSVPFKSHVHHVE